jgi:hypothetical protein
MAIGTLETLDDRGMMLMGHSVFHPRAIFPIQGGG